MKSFNNLSVGQLAISGLLGYGGAAFFSYRYSQITKAQKDLRNITDKKLYLLETHQKIAENYNTLM